MREGLRTYSKTLECLLSWDNVSTFLKDLKILISFVKPQIVFLWLPSIVLTKLASLQAYCQTKKFTILYGFGMVGHLFQNYDTIYVRFFPTYTCNHSCYTIYVRFFVTYTCVLFPSIWPFSYKRAYICAQKIPYICVTNKYVVYGVTESRRIRGTELHRSKKALHVRGSWKVTSVWIKHGRNGRINFEQDLLLIHCPHSSGGCWLPDNGFVGICGLSLERLCTLFHKCWPKQRSIQLEN